MESLEENQESWRGGQGGVSCLAMGVFEGVAGQRGGKAICRTFFIAMPLSFAVGRASTGRSKVGGENEPDCAVSLAEWLVFCYPFVAMGVVPAQGCSELEKEDGLVCHN